MLWLENLKVKIDYNKNNEWNIQVTMKPEVHEDAQGNNAKNAEIKIRSSILKGSGTLFVIVLCCLLFSTCVAIPDKNIPVPKKEIKEKEEGQASDSSIGESILDDIEPFPSKKKEKIQVEMTSIQDMMRSTIQEFLSQPTTSVASAPSTSNASSKKPKAPYKIPRLQLQQQTSTTELLQQQLQELLSENIGPIKHQRSSLRCYTCQEYGHRSNSCPLKCRNDTSIRSMPSTTINQGTYRLASHELAEMARRFSHNSTIMQLLMALSMFFRQTAENMKR